MHSNSYTHIDFHKINQQAISLAYIIQSNIDEVINILLEYESHEVANDEIARTLDLLTSLEENKSYFDLRIGAISVFLPKNQPLYSLTCFVVVPSLQASEVHFRIPYTMKSFLPKLLKILNFHTLFPNVIISSKERLDFLKERSNLFVNPKSGANKPVTDAVIFTGTSKHADELRLVFDKRTLFITNGSGHNPIVVGTDADIEKSVEATLTLALYNQGQDCAAPNSILVHHNTYSKFLEHLKNELKKIKVGQYRDLTCRVGPISNPDNLSKIQTIIVDNRQWLDKQTGGVIRTAEALVEPVIVCKPLSEGGNFEESFAPVLFIQKYNFDSELAKYFEAKQYRRNAMYVTLYGDSKYITRLIGGNIHGKMLHNSDTFLHNTHLHALGIERGTKPYGGYGYGASSVSINGKIIPKPTLPQRDIHELVAKPLVDNNEVGVTRKFLESLTKLEPRNVEKILKLTKKRAKNVIDSEQRRSIFYDTKSTTKTSRYVKIKNGNIHKLLEEPNIEYIASLRSSDINLIKTLVNLIKIKSDLSLDKFTNSLYEIPKKADENDKVNNVAQCRFFNDIYWLLLNRSAGPRLGPFLWDVDNAELEKLLDI